MEIQKKRDNSIVFILAEVLLMIYIIIKAINVNTYLILMVPELLLFIITIFNRDKLKSFFSPVSIFLIACHISFTIKGLNILSISKFSDSYFIRAIIWYSLFVIGVLVSLRIHFKKHMITSYFELENRTVSKSKLFIFILLFLPLAIYLYFWLLGTTNIKIIFNNLLLNRITFQNEGGLYLQTIILLPLKMMVYILFIDMVNNKGNNRIAFLSLFVILELIAFSLGGRGEILFPIFALLFIYEKKKGIINYKTFIIILAIFLIFSGWYGLLRDKQNVTDIRIQDTIQNVLDRYVQLDNLIRFFASPVDIKFGQSFVDFVTSPIPRKIYPEKAYPFNSQMTKIYLPEQFNRKIVSDFTTIAELYYNFSFWGILIGGFVFGLLLNYFSFLFYYDSSKFFQALYPFLMLKPMSILYGGMINSNANMMLILEVFGFILVWLLISKKQEEKKDDNTIKKKELVK